MRIKVNLQSDRKIGLPIHHNHIIQSFIYANLDRALAGTLHDEGYKLGSRTFKLFTFSRLLGRMNYSPQEGFTFYPPVSLFIASPKVDILESLAHFLVKRKELILGKNKVWTEGIEVMMERKFTGKVQIEMLSPVVVYSTLYTPEGKKKTYFYNPQEKEFKEKIRDNLIKKYLLVNGSSSDDNFQFDILPLRVNKNDEKIIIYKQTVIHGWMGRYEITGSPELIEVSYSAGLGSKNSSGFGMWEVRREDFPEQRIP